MKEIDEEREQEILNPDLDSGGTLEILARGEIDIQIRTAKTYPRSIKKFTTNATDLACLDEDTASSCIYALPRGNKTIEGPSARLAEIVMSTWGNCRAGARTISEDDRYVTAQGIFLDLQNNTAISFEVRRKITDRHGDKYNDDMIAVTANAACSIALRNAVFKGIPKALWEPVYKAARQTAIGDAQSLSARRLRLIEYFGKMGVTPDRICSAINKAGIEDIGADEILILKGVATAIKDGDISIENAFPLITPNAARSATGSRTGDLVAALEQEKAAEAVAKAQADQKQPEATEETVPDISQMKEIEEPQDENQTRFTRWSEATWKCPPAQKALILEVIKDIPADDVSKFLVIEYSVESPALLDGKQATKFYKLIMSAESPFKK